MASNLNGQIKSDKKLYVGNSIVNITPTNTNLTNGRNINDSLYVKTILLYDGYKKIILTVIDNQGIPQFIIEEAKKQIELKTKISPEFVMISSTHTHSGIIANSSPMNMYNKPFDNYQLTIINAIVKSVIEANSKIIEAKIGWGSINKPEYVFNRRWYMKKTLNSPYGTKDSVMMNPGYSNRNEIIKPAGPVDPQISFIAIKSLKNEPIAIFSNYSIHYIGAEKNDISADYYGALSKYLQNILIPKSSTQKFISIMSNGTSGDINNVDVASKKPHQVTYEKVNRISLDIAKEIIDEYKKIIFYNYIDLDAITTSINLKIRFPNNFSLKNSNIIKLNKLNKKIFHNQESIYADRIIRFQKIFPNEISVPIQTIKIGDLAFSAIPFEVFAETGLELKQKSPFENYFTIGIANGHWGYLPTPRQYKLGGYETWYTVARVQEDASEIIKNEILIQLNKLKK